jgi:hypothetical protein
MGVIIPICCRLELLRLRLKEAADETGLAASLPGDDRVLVLDGLGICDFFIELRPLKEEKLGCI